jgi:hypothetical protein
LQDPAPQPLVKQSKPKKAANPSAATTKPTTAANAAASVAERIQAELEAAAQPGGQKSSRKAMEYDRPWQQNMRKPGSGPSTLPPGQDGGDAASRPLPEVEVVMEEGPSGPAAPRNTSPGPVRMKDIDPVSHQQLKVE